MMLESGMQRFAVLIFENDGVFKTSETPETTEQQTEV